MNFYWYLVYVTKITFILIKCMLKRWVLQNQWGQPRFWVQILKQLLGDTILFVAFCGHWRRRPELDANALSRPTLVAWDESELHVHAHSVAQSRPSLCNPWTVAHQAPLSMGIFQARMLEWVALTSSRGPSWPRDWTHVSYVSLMGSLPLAPPGKPHHVGKKK